MLWDKNQMAHIRACIIIVYIIERYQLHRSFDY